MFWLPVPVWTTNSKRSVDVEVMYVLHTYFYVDLLLDKHTGHDPAHTPQDFTYSTRVTNPVAFERSTPPESNKSMLQHNSKYKNSQHNTGLLLN